MCNSKMLLRVPLWPLNGLKLNEAYSSRRINKSMRVFARAFRWTVYRFFAKYKTHVLLNFKLGPPIFVPFDISFLDVYCYYVNSKVVHNAYELGDTCLQLFVEQKCFIQSSSNGRLTIRFWTLCFCNIHEAQFCCMFQMMTCYYCYVHGLMYVCMSVLFSLLLTLPFTQELLTSAFMHLKCLRVHVLRMLLFQHCWFNNSKEVENSFKILCNFRDWNNLEPILKA